MIDLNKKNNDNVSEYNMKCAIGLMFTIVISVIIFALFLHFLITYKFDSAKNETKENSQAETTSIEVVQENQEVTQQLLETNITLKIDYPERDVLTGETKMTFMRKTLYYDKNTNYVYTLSKYGYYVESCVASPYIAPNGLPYKYNPDTQTLEEFER